ncbi:MAG TPA: tetratricopeptide repeat protein [Pyrinomonadaceae bacterium]|jgi:tetratricopeptide (TPR) repeat protein|nr:tetratricopeptide repeat protein [Pyrinomonadaceae bacterium]
MPVKAPKGLRALALCAALFPSVGPSAQGRRQVTPSEVAQVVARIRSVKPPARLPPEALRAAHALGLVLLGEGRYAEALDLYDAVQNGSDADAFYGAALANFNLGRPDEAEALARKAVALSGGVNTNTNANADARPAVEAKAREVDALVLLAVVLAVRKDDAGALAAAERAAKLAPAHFDAQFTLGRARYGAGDPAGAARAFRQAVAARPADARAHFFLATSLEQAGDEPGALEAYRALARLQPDAAEGHLGVGVLLTKRGGAGADEGIRELQRAVSIKPDLYEALIALGRALVASGRPSEAVEPLRRASALAPDNPEPHYQLSLAFRRLGRKEEAAQESEAVKRINDSRRKSAPPSP